MRSVVCFSDLKNAALYFDRVLPIAFRRLIGEKGGIFLDFPERIPIEIFGSIVYDVEVPRGAKTWQSVGRIWDAWERFQKSTADYRTYRGSSVGDSYEDLATAYLSNAQHVGKEPLRKYFSTYAAELGIDQSAVLLPSPGTFRESALEDPVVALTNVNLIDTSLATWDQILELRKDSDARVQLRRLRAFLVESYTGQPRSYIEDDLAARIDTYDQTRRKHGFETVVGSISSLLDAKSLQAAAATGLAATLFGGPWAGLGSAAAVELGTATIEFAKHRRVMVDWQNSHELAYMIKLRSLSQ